MNGRKSDTEQKHMQFTPATPKVLAGLAGGTLAAPATMLARVVEEGKRNQDSDAGLN